MKRFAAAQCSVRINFSSLSKASISFSVWPVAKPRLSHPQSRNLLPRVSDIAFAHNLAHPIDLACETRLCTDDCAVSYSIQTEKGVRPKVTDAGRALVPQAHPPERV